MFTVQWQYLPFGSCCPIFTCMDLQGEKSLLLHSQFIFPYQNSLKVVHFFSLHHLWKLYQIVKKCECATLPASFGEG